MALILSRLSVLCTGRGATVRPAAKSSVDCGDTASLSCPVSSKTRPAISNHERVGPSLVTL